VWPALEESGGLRADRGTQAMLAPMASRGAGVGALAWVAKKAPEERPDDAWNRGDDRVVDQVHDKNLQRHAAAVPRQRCR